MGCHLGFAHGFVVLSKQQILSINVLTIIIPLTREVCCGNDPDLNIPWPIDNPKLSEKDSNAPLLADLKKMKILVLGCKGQLGRCLNDQLVNTDHEVIYTSREQIDISDFEVTKSKILEFSPNLIINATAYTAVDKAEEDQKTANLINHLAVKNIADICNQLECWLIHVSTDYVFDGNSNVPYKEDDQTNPQGAYGETKLKGELAIQASGCKHLIIRTAWVFSEYGNNFLKTMLRLGAERDELSSTDQVGCPTYAQDIAKSIIATLTPIYHLRKHTGCLSLLW